MPSPESLRPSGEPVRDEPTSPRTEEVYVDERTTTSPEITPALAERLKLGAEAEKTVERARAEIAANAKNPEKALAMFDRALEYYSAPERKLADTPVYHSTGSYALAKILESGALSSSRNKVTGEQATTGRDAPETSLVVGGYDSSETVAYAYARLNERRSHLVLDKQEVTGTGVAEEIARKVFEELPSLDAGAQTYVRAYIENEKISQKRENMSDEEFLDAKIAELAARKYYFDEATVRDGVDQLRAAIVSAGLQGKEDKIPRLEKRLAAFEGRLQIFQSESDELHQEMRDPFPVMLTYEGASLPPEDLVTPVSALISERRTIEPVGNAFLRQIRAPQDSLPKVREWLDKRLASLPEGDAERVALEAVEIVPLEFFEAKKIVEASKVN